MRSSRRFFSSTLILLLLVVLLAALFKRQDIFDWWRLRGYQPSAAIAQLAADTTMKENARHLFYVFHPELKDRSSFSQSCPERGEKTIVLGCYITNRGIYLFDVDNAQLDGIEQVTAAHELLHAAYDRLSSKDRTRVNTMLENAYAQVTSTRIRSTIDAYQASEDDISNELHSILGTEVLELPAELEAYYARYFSDRQKIVAFSEKYENEFTSRENQAKAYLDQLESLQAALEAKRNAVDDLERSLSDQYAELERQRHTTQNVTEFNANVAAYNNQVAHYRQLINEFNRLVQDYNDTLNKYNTVALEENELLKAIDSRSATYSE